MTRYPTERVARFDQQFAETDGERNARLRSKRLAVATPRHPMFRDHNCWKCREGEKPCAEGNYGTCSYPHARND